MKNQILFILMLLLLISFTAHSQSIDNVFEEWTTTDGTQNFFIKSAVKTDANGASFIAGATLNSAGNYDIFVAKYNEDGDLIWSDQYNGAGNGDDGATDLVLGDSGNVYVTGTVFTSSADTIDVITIAYDDSGTRTWVDVYAGDDGLADFGSCIGFANGKIFVGGAVSDATNGFDFLCLKYDPNGTLVWDEIYDYNGLPDVCTKLSIGSKKVFLAGATNTSGLSWDMLAADFAINTGNFGSSSTTSGGSIGFARVRAMDIDADDNIYLTGTVSNMSSGYDIHTVMIDSLMTVQWAVDYTGSGNAYDEGSALALDPNTGHVYVGGIKTVSGQGADFVTLKYDLSGSLIWAQTWNDSTNGGDTIKAIVVNPSTGDVTVTGSAWNGSNTDYQTIQYTSSGAVNWHMTYNDKYNFDDAPMDIATTSDGGVVVTGQSRNPDNTWSYITVKYLEHAFTIPADSDSVSTSLRWIANRDQLLGTDTTLVEDVKFYSNQCYPNIYMMDDTLSYVFFQGNDTSDVDTLHRIDMTFNSASEDKKLLPLDKEDYWTNYYLGHIPEGRPLVSMYERTFMQDVWPNIDIVYSSNQRGLKYYFVVHSGGEASAVSLEYHGYDHLYVDGNDALILESSVGELVQPQALAYSMNGAGELTLLGWQPDYDVSSGTVTFDNIGSWTGDLVIEVNWGFVGAAASGGGNNLNWSTYFGGSRDDKGNDITTDGANNSYNVGYTHSDVFPVTINPFQQNNAGPTNTRDIFIAKFDKNGHQDWTTLYGGTGEDVASAVVVDASSVYFTGYTKSSNFPRFTPSGSYDQVPAGDTDAFLAEFDQSLGLPNWVTHFGGGGDDFGLDIVLDNANEGIYIGGYTTSGTSSQTCLAPQVSGVFPVCSASTTNEYLQPNLSGAQDGFVAYFGIQHPAGGALLWSTYIGGNESTLGIWSGEGISALFFDENLERLFVGGQTKTINGEITSPCNSNSNGNFPTCYSGTNYFQSDLAGTSGDPDGFIMEFDAQNHALLWSTYFGGSGFERIAGLGLNSDQNLFAVGIKGASPFSNSCIALTNGDFPLCNSNGVSFMQSSHGGGIMDLFITRFSQTRELLWSTPYGGTQSEWGQLHFQTGEAELVIDNNDNLYVIGTTQITPNSSTNTIPLQTNNGWHNQDIGNLNEASLSRDALIVGFESDNSRFWSTAFGGSGTPAGGLSQYDGSEDGMSITYDGDKYLYITGGTYSPNTPTACPPPVNGLLPFCVNGTNNNHYEMDAYISRFDISDAPVFVKEQLESAQDLLIYPNPASGIFNIELKIKGSRQAEVAVYNSLGRIVSIQKVMLGEGHNCEIDLLGFPSGVYLVKIKVGDRSLSGKLVKI